jgi:hypothetical protein
MRWFERVKVTLTATNTVIFFPPDELYNIINTFDSTNSGKDFFEEHCDRLLSQENSC